MPQRQYAGRESRSEGIIPFQRMAAEQRADPKRYLYKRPAVDVNMAPGIISATTNAASALVADMTAPGIQVDGAGGGRTSFMFSTNVSSFSGDGRATASPFNATQTSEALVRAPAAEILGIRSFHRIQKPESLSAASKNPHSCPRPRAAWHHPPGPLSANTGAGLCLAPKLPTICQLLVLRVSVPTFQLPATSRSALLSRGP